MIVTFPLNILYRKAHVYRELVTAKNWPQTWGFISDYYKQVVLRTSVTTLIRYYSLFCSYAGKLLTQETSGAVMNEAPVNKILLRSERARA